MTAPAGFSSRPSTRGQVQYVSIQSVDLTNMIATGLTRQETTVQIDLRYHVGQVHVVPSVEDQWIVRYVGTKWVLDTQLAFNNSAITTVVSAPQQGTVQIGSTSPTGAGPLYLDGSIVTARAPISVAALPTASQPDPTTVAAGTMIYDTNLRQLVYSDGAIWRPLAAGGSTGGGGTGGSVAWTDITGKPSTFPPTVPIDYNTDIDNIPSTFPSAWTSITGKPSTFPPTPPTGTPDGTKFWRDDDVWAVPPGGGGGGSSDLISGEVPTGSVNGTNTVFTLANLYDSASTMVYLNGMRLTRGADYTETGSGTTITFAAAPSTGDALAVSYLTGVTLTLVVGEVPSGTKNGTNVTFTLAASYAAASTSVFRNGLREQLSVGYTEAGGTTITFTTAPLSSDTITVDYQT